MLKSVGDREADLYELFHEAAQYLQRSRLLVRAERTLNRKVEQRDEKEELWQWMKAETVAGTLHAAVPRRRSRHFHTPTIEVRFAQVVLTPLEKIKLSPLSVWDVYAR
jgi:hypothetical protein